MLHDHVPPGTDEPLRFAEPSRRHQDQRHRDVGGRVGEDAGRVRHDHRARGAGRYVDVVVADRHVRDDPKLLARSIEECVVHSVVKEREDRVGAVDCRVQLLRREWRVDRRDPQLGLGPEELERGFGDPAGDRDPTAAHATAGSSRSEPIAASASSMFSSEFAYESRRYPSP